MVFPPPPPVVKLNQGHSSWDAVTPQQIGAKLAAEPPAPWQRGRQEAAVHKGKQPPRRTEDSKSEKGLQPHRIMAAQQRHGDGSKEGVGQRTWQRLKWKKQMRTGKGNGRRSKGKGKGSKY